MPLTDTIRSLIWLPTRVEKGQKDLITYQFIVQFASSIALTVATGVYLWGYETETECTAPSSTDADATTVDVSLRFRNILKIWFAYAVTDMVRCLCVFGFLLYKSGIYAWLYHGLVYNDLVGLVAIMLVHIYRLQYSGQVCSGDYLPESKAEPGFLVERGKYLIGLVIYSWLGLMTILCVQSCVSMAAWRRMHENKQFQPL